MITKITNIYICDKNSERHIDACFKKLMWNSVWFYKKVKISIT
jgi:hypothetical protein